MLRTGVDMIEVCRIDEAILRHGDRFFHRFFTMRELVDAGDRTPALAARFAAKEAVAKALGSGIGEVGWKDIEILKKPGGEPILRLHGAAHTRAAAMGLTQWAVSLSHTHEHAIAFVVAASHGELAGGADPPVTQPIALLFVILGALLTMLIYVIAIFLAPVVWPL